MTCTPPTPSRLFSVIANPIQIRSACNLGSLGFHRRLQVKPVDTDKVLAQNLLDVLIRKSTEHHGFRDVRKASHIFNSVREIGSLQREVVLSQPFFERTIVISEIRPQTDMVN